MSWEITCSTDYINYTANGGDETFTTDPVCLISKKTHFEPSSDYKGPEDAVMTSLYAAQSEHGSFTWEVTARRAGFNGYAEIENIHPEYPQGCEPIDEPDFDIEDTD